MTTKPTGGYAFPHSSISAGMTLRDWYAGLAMQALITRGRLSTCDPDEVATEAFGVADALLKERSK